MRILFYVQIGLLTSIWMNTWAHKSYADEPLSKIRGQAVPPMYSPYTPYSSPHKVIKTADGIVQSTIIGAGIGAKYRLNGEGLPKNTRQTSEGYWLGAEPTPSEIEELFAHNVRVIVTAASMDSANYKALKAKMEDLGMAHVNIPFGGKFPNPKKFYDKIHHYSPNNIYIHCEHGGDRSGALLAYLLVVDQGWSIPRALLAVAFPGRNDTQNLIQILEKRGFLVTQPDIDKFLGIYSAESNGGFGGLKVRSSGYVKLVNTTIDAALRASKTHGKL